jgi:hypothetical protein
LNGVGLPAPASHSDSRTRASAHLAAADRDGGASSHLRRTLRAGMAPTEPCVGAAHRTANANRLEYSLLVAVEKTVELPDGAADLPGQLLVEALVLLVALKRDAKGAGHSLHANVENDPVVEIRIGDVHPDVAAVLGTVRQGAGNPELSLTGQP